GANHSLIPFAEQDCKQSAFRCWTPRNTEARTDSRQIVTFEPAIGFDERDCARLIHCRSARKWSCNRDVGHKDAVARRRGRSVDFPADSIIERQTLPQLPFILQIEVVLVKDAFNPMEVDLTIGLKGQEGVGLQIAEKNLL